MRFYRGFVSATVSTFFLLDLMIPLTTIEAIITKEAP